MIALTFRDGETAYSVLIDELIQAHLDTIEMVLADRDDPSWTSHVVYLPSLIRIAKRFTAEPGR